MRILVTGAGGFAGQHLLRLLLAEGGHEITGGTLDGAPPPPQLLTERELGQVRWVALDITSDASLRGVVEGSQPQQVYHLAGQASVGESYREPLSTWEVNATGTLRLLDALGALEAPIRVLVVSSAEVYGAVPTERQPIPESAPLDPISPYGASKVATEVLGRQAARGGRIEVVIARSFNHAGPGQDARFFLPSMARQISAVCRGDAEPILRVGDLEPKRDFLDVRDGVAAYRTLMERAPNAEAFNVCSGTAYSLRELLEEMVRVSGAGVRIETEAERIRPLEIPLLVGDPSALKALGWAPAIPLDRTLRDLLSFEGAEDHAVR